ncbi:hypothetical protein [Agromyces seonyuensis]|uniref:Uncharacterized protein n=1 Tax=Agromyces seonyuensis TaxID=2662446 RepID=A0A6I4NVJ5_9MICO|nr:hypothetical protein [Agromyces seonyuensis]MWB98340.1 hypothetical protein [Agromyces seonyuensis]
MSAVLPLLHEGASALARIAVLAADGVPDEEDITPGVVGFVATLFVAVIVVLLAVDMVRRVRRVNYRAEIQERLAAEQAAADEAAAAGPGEADAESVDAADTETETEEEAGTGPADDAGEGRGRP